MSLSHVGDDWPAPDLSVGTTGFLVRVRPLRAPLHLPCAEAVERLVARWEQLFGRLERSSDGDGEEFIEEAFYLDAAVVALERIDPLCELYLSTDEISARSVVRDSIQPVELFSPRRALGPRLRRESGYAVGVVERYGELASFSRHAGRPVQVCSHDSAQEESELVRAVVALAAAGWRRVVVKTTIPKYALVVLDTPNGLDLVGARRLLEEALEWTLVYLDGVARAFVVQGFIAMRDEYRIFVVGHQLVTGAGCIDEHTPLVNDAVFDSKLRSQRRVGVDVRDDPVARDELVEFARTVAAAIASERPDLDEYVLDVAFSDDGPVIVELNGIDNAGLYAADPYRLLEARVRLRYGGGVGGGS